MGCRNAGVWLVSGGLQECRGRDGLSLATYKARLDCQGEVSKGSLSVDGNSQGKRVLGVGR